ncbi:MAG: hypothetical protein ACPGF7_08425 [Pontibacterium sp.]
MHRVLQHAANAAALLLGTASAGLSVWAILVSSQGDNLAAFALVMGAMLGFSLAAAAWAISDNAKLIADFKEAIQ